MYLAGHSLLGQSFLPVSRFFFRHEFGEDFFSFTKFVFAQVSSASVERIFSQLKLIIDTVGASALKDNLECRLFERINKYPPSLK